MASWGQQARDPEAVLQQTRERLLANLTRLPRYTCVQEITRKYFSPASRPERSGCAELIAAHNSRKHELPVDSWDRLRLEVAIIGNENIYSWVGAPRFEEAALEKFAGRGPLGSGDFGVFLHEIFSRGLVNFQREEVVEGRRVLEYSYDMPIGRSGYKVKTDGGWTTTAYSGTFRLDAESMDIVSLAVRTAELALPSPSCQATSEVAYGRTLIHDRAILIPHETRLRVINRSGSETFSQTKYAGCREYASKSRVLAAGPQGSAGSEAALPQSPPAPLPAGLHFQARIVTPINSDSAWAGDPIEAVLRSPMLDEKHNVVAPAGSPLHGRMVRVEERSDPEDTFSMTVQFGSIEINGQTVPLHAASYFTKSMEAMRSYYVFRLGDRSADYRFADDRVAGMATFSFRERHLHLKHHDSEWITVSPSEGKAPASVK